MQFEIGDIVTVEKAHDSESRSYEFMSGILDNVWTKDGITIYTVLFDAEAFAYATEIKLFRKA